MTAGTKLLIALLSIPLLIACAIFWGGFVTSTLWGWFLVPFGAPPITYIQAVGIGLVVASFLGSRGINHQKDSDDDDVAFISAQRRAWGNVIGIPAVLLSLGYIVHIFS